MLDNCDDANGFKDADVEYFAVILYIYCVYPIVRKRFTPLTPILAVSFNMHNNKVKSISTDPFTVCCNKEHIAISAY